MGHPVHTLINSPKGTLKKKLPTIYDRQTDQPTDRPTNQQTDRPSDGYEGSKGSHTSKNNGIDSGTQLAGCIKYFFRDENIL